MARAASARVVVTIDDEHLTSIAKVAAELTSAGLVVEHVMAMAGVIAGEAPLDKLATLRAIPGVQAVEPDEEMRAI